MLVCVFVYLANVCENDVVVRCCMHVSCVCACVRVRASHCVVVGSIPMYISVLALSVVYRWRWTCDDVCICGCVDGGVYMDGAVVCEAVRAAWTLTVFCCSMALLADGWDVI